MQIYASRTSGRISAAEYARIAKSFEAEVEAATTVAKAKATEAKESEAL